MWGRVESLAKDNNPNYRVLHNNNLSPPPSALATSPSGNDEDPDISYEKLEAEAREVSLTRVWAPLQTLMLQALLRIS